MAASGRALSRRSFFISGLAAASARGEGVKGGSFPSDAGRYADPATELKKATAEFQPVLDKSEKG